MRGKNVKGEEILVIPLFKCAPDHCSREVVEEFAVEDGELKLVRKKVTKREVPPDLKALKIILESGKEVSDEELIEEKRRLLIMLENEKSKEEK